MILLQQGQLQRIIAQGAAIIAQPAVRILTRRTHRQRQRLLSARRIAHRFKGDPQLQQRQARTRLLMTTPDFAEGTKGGFLLTGQHQGGIGLSGETAGRRVIAVANGHQSRLLQIAQQTLVTVIHRLSRYAIALLACSHKEIHGIGGQPVLFRPLFVPQRKSAIVTLHMQQSGNTDLYRRTALFITVAGDAQCFELRGVGVKRREQTAGGLFQAAIGIGFQVANIAGEIQRRLTAEHQLSLQRRR